MQFKSALKEEINTYLQVRVSAGKYVKHAEYILLNLDMFLQQSNISEKALTEETITSWCKTLMCKSSTKKTKLLVINNFAKYLVSLGSMLLYLKFHGHHQTMSPMFSQKKNGYVSLMRVITCPVVTPIQIHLLNFLCLSECYTDAACVLMRRFPCR